MKNLKMDQSGDFFFPNKKKKKMDDQLQQQDSNTNWKQTYGSNSGFVEANVPSRRNMTTGAPFQPMMSMSTSSSFQESGDTVHNPFGTAFQNAPFRAYPQPMMSTGTGGGAIFPETGTTTFTNNFLERMLMTVNADANFPKSRTTYKSAPFQCIKMLKDLAFSKEAKDKNFVFSPCSIQLALSLLANGAKGSTLDQILKFVEAEDRNHLNSVASELVNKLNGSSTEGGPALSLVSGVWVDNSTPLNPTFVTVAQSVYCGKAEVVDFKNKVKAEEVLDKVNKWAEEATQGLIKSVLPKGSFNPYTRIVLANALYFKGKWAQVFVKSSTKDFNFYLLDGKSVEVPFMTNKKGQFVRTFDDFQVLRLPYKTCSDEYAASLSMYIILPNKRDGLCPLTEMVCSDPLFFKKYVHNSYPTQVEMGSFWVPKFKITHDFEASKVLQDAGLKLPFSNQADFDNLLLNPSGHLKVSKVVHKSYIKVDEEGTEAAAVTCITAMFACASAPPPPVNFVADHPFMFVVRDDTSGMVLFMGHVVNPLLE